MIGRCSLEFVGQRRNGETSLPSLFFPYRFTRVVNEEERHFRGTSGRKKIRWFVFSQSVLAAATDPLLRIVFGRSERKSGEREALWPRVCVCVTLRLVCLLFYTALCANCPRIRIASIGCVRAACCEPSGHELLLSRASRSHASRFMRSYIHMYVYMYTKIFSKQRKNNTPREKAAEITGSSSDE